MIDREDVAKGLWLLADAFGVRLGDARIDAYHAALSSRFGSVAEWRQAVARAAEDCERFPVPKVLIAMRPRTSIEPHRCSLCDESAPFVWGSVRGGRPHLVPCPNRMDVRAADWYAEKADQIRSTPEEARNSAEASHRAIQSKLAGNIMRKLDPDEKLFARGERALAHRGETR